VYRNTADGIHCGGGPHSFIHNNRIYENGAAGISFCYGNRKLIITDNEIMRNLAGIYCMGNGERERDSTADRYSIVSQNIIYENKRAGLASGQGDIGPQDFVFTDNIVQNNQQEHWRRPEAPAGIAFVNPQRCVIANNRCFDDRATYPRLVLDKPAKAGDSVVSVALADRNVTTEPFAVKDDRIRIKDGPNTAVHTVLGVKNRDLQLTAPLVKNYAAGTPVVRLGSQKWGIAVLGTEAVDNVISGNVCAGNASGGILVQRRDTNVFSGNAGTIVDYDVGKLPLENLYPSIQKVAMPNGDFEGSTGWVLPPGRAEYDTVTRHAGNRAMRLTRAQDKGVVDADYPLSVKPNCRYRLTVFLQTNAFKAEKACFPAVMAIGRNGTLLGPCANPGGYGPDPEWTGGAKWEAGKWLQFGCEFQTGPDDTGIIIKGRAQDGVGASWVDDIAVDMVERLAE
jgi:parallel beta-helix repeat protein